MEKKGKKRVYTVIAVIVLIILAIIAINVIPNIIERISGGEEDEEGEDDGEQEINEPPVAIVTANKTRIEVGIANYFDANQSYDPDPVNATNKGIEHYKWDWDDGSEPETVTNASTSHTWSETGVYNVTLMVVDQEGASDNASITIHVVHKDQEINSGTVVMIGEPILVGVIGNSTEERWNISEDAQLMEITVTIQGVWVRGTSACELDVVLYDPREDIMNNETARVVGSRTIEWSFGPDEIDLVGEYYIFIYCKNGVSAVNIAGLVSYL